MGKETLVCIVFMGPGLYMVTKKYPTSFYHKSNTGDPGHSQSLYQRISLQVIQKDIFLY